MSIPIRIDETIYYEAKKVASADVLLSKLQDKSLAEPFNFEGKSE